jgi:FKBP-type peptidyl-prolyl cis-trans isomerase
VPQSRHRKTAKAKKRPKGTYAASGPKPHTGKNRNLRIGAIALVAALAVSAVAYIIAHRSASVGSEIVTASGLKYVDIVQGNGPSPRLGQTFLVNYTGTLENGSKFADGRSSEFRLGEVIPGWNEGIQSMKVGGKRKLIVPAPLGYGAQGRPPSIPPNSTLIFEVELVGIK